MPTPDDENSRRIFERLSLLVAGEKVVDGLAAAQDLYCALICMALPDKTSAMAFARTALDDVQGTIRKNFDWYRQQAEAQQQRPAALG